ncbi:MAG: glycosyltransferase [Parasporobacterium sp.]|nr:glycosyltransferase [Parasporobacterium sp.]
MKKCIDSLLEGGEYVEIIIVDDGSTDDTASIADAYLERYPSIVKVIHKPNGGHGSGINYGLREATGLFFKVIDSDDWLDKEALLSLLGTIRRHVSDEITVDLYITNFVYERSTDNTSYVSSYRKYFPINRVFSWSESKSMHLWHMLLMHAIATRTEILKIAEINLPEHTFYVDNLFSYIPLPYIKNIYYSDIDLYRYYIGRSDQSVTFTNMVNRYDQQIRVTTCMIYAHNYEVISSMDKALQQQMYHFLHSVLANTYFFTTQKNEEERHKKLDNMWKALKDNDPTLYTKLRSLPMMFILTHTPWKLSGFITRHGYKILTRITKLGA